MFIFSINFRIEEIGHRTKSNEGNHFHTKLKYKLEDNIDYM